MLIAKQIEAKRKQGTVNHVWIYDRSQSMIWLLEHVVEDMIGHRRTLNAGDTLTLGWFSTEGQYNWIVKGHKIGTDSPDHIEAMLRRNRHVIGLTCFSEIIRDLPQTLSDLGAFSGVNVLHFFTDGYPVVSHYEEEIKRIMHGLWRAAPQLTSSLFIGYGDYYNRDLLTEMAAKVEGSVIHASDLATYSMEARQHSQNVAPKRQVDVFPATMAFYIKGGNVVEATIDDMGCVRVPMNVDVVYMEDGQASNGVTQPIEGQLGRALLRLQQGRQDTAIELLGQTGDVALIDAVANAYTNAELGEAEKRIRDAIQYPNRRFTGGKDMKHLPDPDAFCILDLLELLEQDKNARFYPHDPMFQYKRTGLPSTPVEGYPRFIRSEANPGVDFQPEWHRERANVNLLTKVNGLVEVGKNEVGLDKMHYTWRFRDYTIIKDGRLNVTMLPISSSRTIHRRLKDMGLTTAGWMSEHPYTLDLTQLPLINRQFTRQYSSLSALQVAVMGEVEHMAALKVYRYYLKELRPEKAIVGFNQEQQDFLRGKGITHNGFNPPVTKEEAVDYYEAKTFEVQVKGCSSLPSVADCLKKRDSGKEPTPSQRLMLTYVEEYERSFYPGEVSTLQPDWLEGEIQRHTAALEAHRTYLRRVKFAVIVGKMWFEELQGQRDGAVWNDLVFKVKTEKVPY